MRTLLMLLGLMAAAPAWCQREAYYDSLTLSDYYAGNWKALMVHGQLARKEKAASFYTLKRTGYAAFALHQYAVANRWYERAEKFDAQDADVLTMFFKNHFELGQTQQWRDAQRDMSYELRQLNGLGKPSTVDYVGLESGFGVSNDVQKNLNAAVRTAPQGQVLPSRTSHFLNDNLYYWQASANFQPKRHVALVFQYSGFAAGVTQREAYVAFAKNGQVELSNHTMADVYQPTDSLLQKKFTVQQHQFYLRLCLTTRSHWMVMPYLHGLFNLSQPVEVQAAPRQLRLQTNPYTLTQAPVFSFQPVSALRGGIIGGLAVAKQLGKINVDADFNVTYYDTSTKVQLSAGVNYLPFGNLKLVITPRLTYAFVSGEHRVLAALTVAAQLHSRLYAHVSGGYGNRSATNEGMGSLNFLGADAMPWFVGGGFYVPVLRQLHAYAGYQYRPTRGSFDSYSRPNSQPVLTTTNFSIHYISIGLKFLL
ncbi:MAG: hypothetical protein U0T84_03835 [Chitinophagales bacterium]